MMVVWEKQYLATKNKVDEMAEKVIEIQSQLDSDLIRVQKDLNDLLPNQEKKSA